MVGRHAPFRIDAKARQTWLELYKPLEIEEALNILKSSPDRQFIVFNDIDGKMRVLYRRGDGRFGLY